MEIEMTIQEGVGDRIPLQKLNQNVMPGGDNERGM